MSEKQNRSDLRIALLTVQAACPTCDKAFEHGSEWAYKRVINGDCRCFCSWGCMRKYDQMVEEKGRRNRD